MNEVTIALTEFQAGETDYGLDIDAADHGRVWGRVEHRAAGFRLIVKPSQEARDRALYRITSSRDILLDNAADRLATATERRRASARGRSMNSLTRKLIEAAGGPEAFSPDARRWIRY